MTTWSNTVDTEHRNWTIIQAHDRKSQEEITEAPYQLFHDGRWTEVVTRCVNHGAPVLEPWVVRDIGLTDVVLLDKREGGYVTMIVRVSTWSRSGMHDCSVLWANGTEQNTTWQNGSRTVPSLQCERSIKPREQDCTDTHFRACMYVPSRLGSYRPAEWRSPILQE